MEERLTDKQLEFGAGQIEYVVHFSIFKKSGQLLDDLFVSMSYRNSKDGVLNQYEGSTKVFHTLEGLTKLTQIVDCKETTNGGFAVKYEYSGMVLEVFLRRTKSSEIEKRKVAEMRTKKEGEIEYIDPERTEKEKQITDVKEMKETETKECTPEEKNQIVEDKMDMILFNLGSMQEVFAKKIDETTHINNDSKKVLEELKTIKEENEKLKKKKEENWEEEKREKVWKSNVEEELKRLSLRNGEIEEMYKKREENMKKEIETLNERLKQNTKNQQQSQMKCGCMDEIANIKEKLKAIESLKIDMEAIRTDQLRQNIENQKKISVLKKEIEGLKQSQPAQEKEQKPEENVKIEMKSCDYEKVIAKINEEIEQIKKNVDEIKTKGEEEDEKEKKQNDEIENIKKLIETVEESHQSQNEGSQTDVTAEMKTITEKIDELEKALNVNKDIDDKTENDVSELKNKISEIEEKENSTQIEFHKKDKEFEEMKSAFNMMFETQEKLKNELEKNKEDDEKTENDLKELKGEIEKLRDEKQKETNVQHIEKIENVNNETDQEIDKLRNEIDELKSEIDKLKTAAENKSEEKKDEVDRDLVVERLKQLEIALLKQNEKIEKEKVKEKGVLPRVVYLDDFMSELCVYVDVKGINEKALVFVERKNNILEVFCVVANGSVFKAKVEDVDIAGMSSVLEVGDWKLQNDMIEFKNVNHKFEMEKEKKCDVWPRLVHLYHYFGEKYTTFLDVQDRGERTKDIEIKIIGEERKADNETSSELEPTSSEDEKKLEIVESNEIQESEEKEKMEEKEVQHEKQEVQVEVKVEEKKEEKKEEKPQNVFVYSSVPTQFHSRRIQQLGKLVPNCRFTDFWNGYGCGQVPDKVILYYAYEKEGDSYKEDLDALKTVYPNAKTFAIVLTYQEYCLRPFEVGNDENVFVINVTSNVLEEGETTKKFAEELSKK
ncbi:structural maintenance of chromosome protein, putative [Entamoeba invadens IP1]|uniref:Structural maintenance of chromosome protein, putative n=1 Tax=Entamoeba invadens IP1 TaxID=370355 RepID=A0A0A1UC08_ENTIV|nr:structural maintenance of chromosome protein, putative [Entamoeba invadens IP1]ELP91243.1 structural maintenance of chromosome protein, putative [Entamoeba invadens IP1]|eukprot:XP_004258014.1 structural maintenance of chromosome protein, putative [Entamoeba invadens IP1]